MITLIYRVDEAGVQEAEPILSVEGLLTTDEADIFIAAFRNLPRTRRRNCWEFRCYHLLTAGSPESAIKFHTWVL